jgi:UDP-N-acetylmuramyl pentapeptide phosphotransferase/UDP-N-acetylglucosamine-1-phosphate transferase
VGISAGLATAQATGHSVPWSLAAVAAGLATVGLVDDALSIPPHPRLVAQVAAGAVAGGIAGRGWWPVLVGAVAMLVIVNAVNFMDGIDGVSGFTMLLWGLVAAVMGTAYNSDSLALVGAVTGGAALGFLPSNLSQARLFLGDVGSYMFGSLVVVGLLVGWRDDVSLPILISPLAVHLLDTSSTAVRRASQGRSLLAAHRDHVYQRLVSVVGLSHRVVAAFVLVLACSFTLSTAYWPRLASLVFWVVFAAAYITAPLVIGSRMRWARKD